MSPIELRSEIAGKVWKIEAKPGDMVSEDDTVIILESMKMEIPVVAPANCRIIDIRVAEEDTVAEGQVIATIEKA